MQVLQQILELIAQPIGFVFLLLVDSIASDRAGRQNADMLEPLLEKDGPLRNQILETGPKRNQVVSV